MLKILEQKAKSIFISISMHDKHIIHFFQSLLINVYELSHLVDSIKMFCYSKFVFFEYQMF